MKTLRIFFLIVATSAVLVGQQTEFPVGVMLFGEHHADGVQLRDDLNINWLQVWCSDDPNDGNFDANTLGLRIIPARGLLESYSRGQRMFFKAERTSDEEGRYNFFGSHETGTVRDNAQYCEFGTHLAGYMVRSPQPDGEYHYDRIDYYAAFKMKISKQGSTRGERGCRSRRDDHCRPRGVTPTSADQGGPIVETIRLLLTK